VGIVKIQNYLLQTMVLTKTNNIETGFSHWK